MSRSVARAASAALGLLAAVTLALPVAAQPPGELPVRLAPDLPPGVENLPLCAGPIVPDLPPGVQRAVAAASDELPPLPEWCDGTCTIDIAFFYAPEAIDGREDRDRSLRLPATVGELRARAFAAINFANVAWRRSGLDAELRFVGMERDSGLNGLDVDVGIEHVQRRLAYARQKYGADLVYAITGVEPTVACGLGYQRIPGPNLDFARQYIAAGSIWAGCFGNTSGLAHEVGHNLGLDHDPGHSLLPPYVPFGHGYRGTNRLSGISYTTIMGPAGNLGLPAHFSTPEPLHGRVIGNANVSDASRALRYTIPDATRYSPTVIPHRNDDPHGYGCRPSAARACLNERRFDVSARYTTQSVSRAPAQRLDTLGLGDSGALFYFFGEDNPEMLLKVVNGCWLNDHWWVFGSAATDLVYEVAIEDLADGGGTVEYRHNGGGVIVADNGYSTGSGVIADTRAFPCGLSAAARASEQRRHDGPAVAMPAVENLATVRAGGGQEVGSTMDHGCPSYASASCLNNWRFKVSPAYAHDPSIWRSAKIVDVDSLGNSASLFYFFQADNPEMLVKVVDGCGVNGHWWVFGSAATDLEYWVLVQDYATASTDGEGRLQVSRSNRYRHLGGGVIEGPNGYRTRSGVIAHTTAFPCNE